MIGHLETTFHPKNIPIPIYSIHRLTLFSLCDTKVFIAVTCVLWLKENKNIHIHR